MVPMGGFTFLSNIANASLFERGRQFLPIEAGDKEGLVSLLFSSQQADMTFGNAKGT